MSRSVLSIMVVDDDPVTLHVTARILSQRGHRVIQRSSAIGSTVAISREQPDVVLLDVNMPGLTGDRLANLLKTSTSGYKPTVILYSGMFQEQLEELARSCGAAGVLEKNGDSRQLAEAVEKIAARCAREAARVSES